jgi:hypothetical protein
MLAFSVEVVIQVGNEHYVLCFLRKHGANIVNFIDYGAEFEKNLCTGHEFLLNRGQNVQENL